MNLDLTMPTVLFLVALLAMFLNKKVESKLKGALENREFRTRDTILLVATMGITISVVVLIPELALMAIFLFAYSMLLFIFTHIFSDFNKTRASIFCLAFLVITIAAALALQLNLVTNTLGILGPIAFYGLSLFTLSALIYEHRRTATGERWYLAVLPPALFICLYAFYNRTSLWFPYILNLYGIAFAVLIILYMGTLFTWKTTLIFTGLLTIVDTILVLVTRTMVSAAMSVQALRLPVLVSLPVLPLIVTERGLQYMSLGLGDFFFAGLLATQTMKKYGRLYGVCAIITMALSFGIFEILLIYYEVSAFPGTVMIIIGWLPIAFLSFIRKSKR
jgi:hypothetical protein